MTKYETTVIPIAFKTAQGWEGFLRSEIQRVSADGWEVTSTTIFDAQYFTPTILLNCRREIAGSPSEIEELRQTMSEVQSRLDELIAQNDELLNKLDTQQGVIDNLTAVGVENVG